VKLDNTAFNIVRSSALKHRRVLKYYIISKALPPQTHRNIQSLRYCAYKKGYCLANSIGGEVLWLQEGICYM